MPNPTVLERHWQDNRELLVSAARDAGIDAAILVKISGFESGFDPTARPINHRHPEKNTVRQFDGTMALSSAYGFGQFTDAAWLDTVRRYGAKYGVSGAEHLTRSQANAPGLRDDPRLQAAMLAEFTGENIMRGQLIGGGDTSANVYALHNLGSGDGPRFLEALRERPDAAVSAVLSARVIGGNPALYGDGSRTVAEAYRVMGAKMAAYAAFADHAPQRDSTTVERRPTAPKPAHTVTRAGVSHGSASIYNEARLHFLDDGDHFEYGRGDIGRVRNHGGDGRTDQSRNERDLDGDGRKGVDCSSFVWRGLRNAGYAVPDSPFTTHDLFHGNTLRPYARQHFDAIDAAHARRDHGALKAGDLLLFREAMGTGQHVGIFKGYDANGHIEFIGSQTTRGPGQQTAPPGGYWNGRHFEIVGALRAKPEFQVRAPLHGALPTAARPHETKDAASRELLSGNRAFPEGIRAAQIDQALQPGQSGPAVAHLQRRLFELGYHNEHGKPLGVTGNFGSETLFALRQFQREHGLQGKGVAGPKTAIALERAERALVSHPSHPQHPLYEQALDRLHAAEKARGIASGPHSERVAAALVVECVRKGITRIDRVDIGNGVVQAVQHRSGPPESGLGNTDAISLARSSTQTLGESSRQCHEVAIDAAARRAAPMPERVLSPAPAMTLAR
jgi:hypothetical protein